MFVSGAVGASDGHFACECSPKEWRREKNKTATICVHRVYAPPHELAMMLHSSQRLTCTHCLCLSGEIRARTRAPLFVQYTGGQCARRWCSAHRILYEYHIVRAEWCADRPTDPSRSAVCKSMELMRVFRAGASGGNVCTDAFKRTCSAFRNRPTHIHTHSHIYTHRTYSLLKTIRKTLMRTFAFRSHAPHAITSGPSALATAMADATTLLGCLPSSSSSSAFPVVQHRPMDRPNRPCNRTRQRVIQSLRYYAVRNDQSVLGQCVAALIS